jgi:hypothetical protein
MHYRLRFLALDDLSVPNTRRRFSNQDELAFGLGLLPDNQRAVILLMQSHQSEIQNTRMTISGTRNKNHSAEPGVTDNFVQCHSRGGAALCATARNV